MQKPQSNIKNEHSELHTTPPPVFIAGCGRSGTTYLKMLVDRHPDFFIPTECLFISDYLRFAPRLPVWFWRKMLTHEFELKLWYSKAIPAGNDFAQVISTIHQVEMRNAQAVRWGQKTPRFIRHLELFRDSFPGCQWLLIYRDPRAVAASMLNSTRHVYSVAQACRRWKFDNQAIMQMLETNCFPKDVLTVKYENLICDFDTTLDEIFSFLGVESYDKEKIIAADSLPFDLVDNTVRNGMKPDVKSVDSWKKTLTKRQIKYIEEECRDAMTLMGYEFAVDAETSKRPRRDKLAAAAQADEKLSFIERKWLQLAAVKNIFIIITYLLNWPGYLFKALFRIASFRILSRIRYLRNVGGGRDEQ